MGNLNSEKDLELCFGFFSYMVRYCFLCLIPLSFYFSFLPYAKLCFIDSMTLENFFVIKNLVAI